MAIIDCCTYQRHGLMLEPVFNEASMDMNLLCEEAIAYLESHARQGDDLMCYVTGFTPATTALIRACLKRRVSLTLFHWNKEDGVYTAQRIMKFSRCPWCGGWHLHEGYICPLCGGS